MGVDAFGEKPYYEDRGIMQRAIIAIGKQDADLGSMTPCDERIEIMGGSSDHIILDVTKCAGDRIQTGLRRTPQSRHQRLRGERVREIGSIAENFFGRGDAGT